MTEKGKKYISEKRKSFKSKRDIDKETKWNTTRRAQLHAKLIMTCNIKQEINEIGQFF